MSVMRHLLGAVLLLCACGGGDDDSSGGTLYERMGGEPGVRDFVEDIVTAVKSDEKINGYFRNSSVDLDHMSECMVKLVGAATGGPQTYPDADCRSMAEAHQGLGVSSHDFDDFANAVVIAASATDLDATDRTALIGVFTAHQGAVVEDQSNDGTIYQRVGRKPAIAAVVTAFEERVAADDRVNGFFAGITYFTRIHACLTRQVCSLDGPCIYGEETADEFPGLTNQTGCRTMAAAHFGLSDGNGPILIEDFNAIAENLVMELTAAGVAQADIDTIVSLLVPLCPDIVAGGTGCP